ncbi:MAG: TolC family protein [Bdellovibrio sp.]|nr:TolC family protein [Bdellovibrio sp.]
MKKLVICSSLFLAFALTAHAESVDLKTILNETSGNSPAVAKSKASYDEASWKKVETFQGFLPSLSWSVNYLTNKRYMLVDVNLGGAPVSIAQVIPTTAYTLNATLPLFDGFASTNRFLAGKKLESSAQHEHEWTQFSVKRQATLQFYRTLAAQTLKDVAEQNLKTLNDHLKDAQALKKAGIGTSYDVLRVEVQVSEAKSETLNANDNYEGAKLKLAEIIGKQNEIRDLQGKLPIIDDAVLTIIAALKPGQRTDVLALRERADSLHDLDAAAGRYWTPKLSAYGQYQYYNNINDKFNDDAAYREAYQVGLNLTWNLFDGMGSIARAGQASAQAAQVEQILKMVQIKANQDFEFWKRKFTYFKTVYTSRIVEVDKSSEAIRYAKAGRRAGTRTTTDLLDAELDLFRSRAGQINAQMGAIEALINLELASGQQLYQFN